MSREKRYFLSENEGIFGSSNYSISKDKDHPGLYNIELRPDFIEKYSVIWFRIVPIAVIVMEICILLNYLNIIGG